MIYVNKIEKRITFKIKTGHYLELLTPEAMKLLRITKMPHLEITKVVLIYCNYVNYDYQQDSRILYIFVPNESFDQLLYISPKNFIFVKTFS